MPKLPTEQINRAQILYQKGDYAGALTLFTAILEKWPDKKNPPMHILDHRVASLIKLRRYDDALKEARTMIKVDKTISSGYLRAGQILTKLEQDKKAVQIYELGLASVIDPAAMKRLHAQAAEIRKNIVPDKAKDWLMTAVPVEVLEMILGMLEFSELVRLLAVCRTWKTILTGMPRLWRHIDTYSTRRKGTIKHKTLETYGNRSRWSFTRLEVPLIPLGSFRMLLAKGRSLETLKLRADLPSTMQSRYLPSIFDSKSLRSLDVGSFFLKFAQVVDIMHTLPDLIDITTGIDSLPRDILNSPGGRIPARMKSVDFHHQPGCPSYNPDNLLLDAIGLKSLSMTGISEIGVDLRHLTHLKDVYLRSEESSSPIELPTSIERISLACDQRNAFDFPVFDTTEDGRLSRLQYLKIGSRTSAGQIVGLLRECGDHLKELDLTDIWGESLTYLMERVCQKGFLALEKLVLRESNIKDEDLSEIGQHCPQLQVCHLTRERFITGSGLTSLVQRARRLKYIRSMDNLNVNLDFVEWARQQGITVDYCIGTGIVSRTHRLLVQG